MAKVFPLVDVLRVRLSKLKLWLRSRTQRGAYEIGCPRKGGPDGEP